MVTAKRAPSLQIATVSVDVPIVVPPSDRTKSDEPAIRLELWDDAMRVWDEVMYSQCGETYSYDAKGRTPFGFARSDLSRIPYFDQVYRYLVDQYAANRNNPLGKFLAPGINAMDQALCERDGTSVYFAQAGGRIKIGWSRNVAARITQLQTGNAEPVQLVATTPGARSRERQLHDQFAAARVSGEWFEATPELIAYIADLNRSNPSRAVVRA